MASVKPGIGLDHPWFREQVLADINGKRDLPHDAGKMMRNPEAAEIWRMQLIAIKREHETRGAQKMARIRKLEAELRSKADRAYAQAEIDEERARFYEWQGRSAKFYEHIEKRLLEANEILARKSKVDMRAKAKELIDLVKSGDAVDPDEVVKRLQQIADMPS